MENSLNVTPFNCTMSTHQESASEQLAERTDYTYSASKSYRTSNAKKKVRSPNMSRRSLRTKDFITIESGLDREDVTPTNMQLYYDNKQFCDRAVRASEDEVHEVSHPAGSNPFMSSSSTVTHTLHYGLDYDSETDDFTRQSTSRHSLLRRAKPLTASSAVPQPILSQHNNVHIPCVMKNELHESALSRLSSASYTVLTALPRALSRIFSGKSQASQSPVNNNSVNIPSAYHLSNKPNKRTLRSGKTITTYDSEDEVDQIESEAIQVGINGTVKRETHYSVFVYLLTFFSLISDAVSTACTTALSTSTTTVIRIYTTVFSTSTNSVSRICTTVFSTSTSAVSKICTTLFSTSTNTVSRICTTVFSTSTSAVSRICTTVYSAAHKACTLSAESVKSGTSVYLTQPCMSLYHSLVMREEEDVMREGVMVEESESTNQQKSRRSACGLLWWLLLPLLLLLLLLTGLGYSEKTAYLPAPLDAASVTLSDSASSLANYSYYIITSAFSYTSACAVTASSSCYAFAVTSLGYIYTSTVSALSYLSAGSVGALQYILGAVSDSCLTMYDSVRGLTDSSVDKESTGSYFTSLSTASWGLFSTISTSLQWLVSTLVYGLMWIWHALLSTLWMLWSVSSSGVSQVCSGVVSAGQSMSALLVIPFAYKQQKHTVVDSSPHPSMEEVLAKLRGLEGSLLAMEDKIASIEKSQGLFGATVSKCCDGAPHLSLADVNNHVTSLISSLIGYSGKEASPDDLKSWMQSYFVAKSVMDDRLKDINAELLRLRDESGKSVESQLAALRDTQSLVMSQVKEDLSKQLTLKVEGLHEIIA